MDLDMDYVDQEEDEDGPEIEMNWNLANYLPEGGACQKNFNTVIAGYITGMGLKMCDFEWVFEL